MASLLSFNFDDAMHTVYTVFFDKSNWVADGTTEVGIVTLCSGIFDALCGTLDLDTATCQWALGKFSLDGVVRRFREVLSDDAYFPGRFPFEYMRMLSPFPRMPRVACAFVDNGFHILAIQRTWSGLRRADTGTHFGCRYYVEHMQEYVHGFKPFVWITLTNHLGSSAHLPSVELAHGITPHTSLDL